MRFHLGISRALPFGLLVYCYVVTVSVCTLNSILKDLEWRFFLWCNDEGYNKNHIDTAIFGCGETVKTQPASG